MLCTHQKIIENAIAMVEMREKRARQHLGLNIGSYKDLFELNQREELGEQMPEFEKGALKRALTNLLKT